MEYSVREEWSNKRFIEGLLDQIYHQVDEQLHQEDLDNTTRNLLGGVYEKIDEDQAVVASLCGTVFDEIDKEERIEKAARSLIECVYIELEKENEDRLERRRIMKKKNLAKRQQKIQNIALKRKAARKETKLLRLINEKIEEESNKVEQLEVIVESKVSESLGANCQIEELRIDKETLLQEEGKAEMKVEDLKKVVYEIKKRQEATTVQAEDAFKDLQILRRKTYKKTKLQKIKSFFTCCFCAEPQYHRDFEIQVNENLFDCDAILFSSSSSSKDDVLLDA